MEVDASSAIVDPLLIAEIFAFLSVREIPNVALVCKTWNSILASNSHLWQRFFQRDFPELFLDGNESSSLSGLFDDVNVYSPHDASLNRWRAVYRYRSAIRFTWDETKILHSHIKLSNGNLTATHIFNTREHSDIYGTRSFRKGKYSWSVRIDRLEGKYWIALGVITDTKYHFQYNVPHILGEASNGRAMAPSWKFNMHDGWANKDLIRLELDCDNLTLKLFVNGAQYQQTIPLPEGQQFYPWANIYNPGGTLTIEKQEIL